MREDVSAGGTGAKVAVIGAGVGGLAAAIRLAEAGASVRVYDPAPHAGGLAGGFQIGGNNVERFYHHLFRSDRAAQRWVADLGLSDRMQFLPATMGFYSKGRLYRFGTAASLLRFSPLRFRDRLRVGLRIRSLGSNPDPSSFENVTALDWLRSRASPQEIEVFWMPLLQAKFGRDSEIVSMAWLWARFRARVGDSVGQGERLGYLRGGFQQLADTMCRRAEQLGVKLNFGCGVEGITVTDGRVTAIRAAGQQDSRCDAVVWTPSLRLLTRAVPELSSEYRERCLAIEYHHAVVVVLELPASVLPYYWVTVGDSRLPFTVAVEQTRLVEPSDYGGRTVVYLGRYAPPDDPLLAAPDDEITRTFVNAAAEAFSPGFRDYLAAHVFRAPAAQPIVPPGWQLRRPALRTGIQGLVAANMAQIYPWDRGINYSLSLGEDAAQAILEEMAQVTSAL